MGVIHVCPSSSTIARTSFSCDRPLPLSPLMEDLKKIFMEGGPRYSGGGRANMDDTHMRIPYKGNPSGRQKESKGGKVKFLIVAIDYFTKLIEAKPVATITDNQVKKFIWDNIVYRFGLPGEIVSDNGKQFRDNPFKDWSLGEGIKARLDERSKD
ncbi:reverse transcriptase domain-containing protein [Tanacetum coccineum]|uniref:Reverse transcriptase domain-containing protein n=1 Tax=Tanacetum coccineum TaxID=301880 RepID=A0ABQ5IK44_9ASTR